MKARKTIKAKILNLKRKRRASETRIFKDICVEASLLSFILPLDSKASEKA